MGIRALFPTPLFQSTIEDGGTIVADLRQTILELEKVSPGTTHSNDGGWQSTAQFSDWGGPSGMAIMNAVRATVDGLTAHFDGDQLKPGQFDWKVQAWANVNRAGAGNHQHFHPGAFWSACFYVDDGGIDGRQELGGAIEFSDPRGIAPMMYAPALKMKIANCFTAGLAERVFPKTGMLLIFPAWLAHSVTRYTGSGIRISVSMNFCI